MSENHAETENSVAGPAETIVGDLLIRGGTVLDPAQGLHAPADVVIADGLIRAILKPGTAANAVRTIDATGLFVVPGLVDFHTHAFEGGSRFGINPDRYCLPEGVTTVLDAGSAGAYTWNAFAKELATRQTKVYAMLNISSIGMPDDGELLHNQWSDVRLAVDTIEANRERIAGVKIRLSSTVVGDNLLRAFDAAIEAAERTGLPLLVHPNAADMPMGEILTRLRKGDVVTHCFNTTGQAVVDADGAVRPEAMAARERGVLFDVGHGFASFSFDRAERAIAQGFVPDMISSDLHTLNVDGPVWSLAHVLSKFLALGMPFEDVLQRATAVPGGFLDREGGVGTLRVGTQADVVLLAVDEGEFVFEDCRGWAQRTGTRKIRPVAVVQAGRVVENE